MRKLSLVIVAKNEERTIGRVLAATKDLCAEVILVDSGSTDKTVEIARQMGAQCSFQKWLGYAAQKNYALSLATSEWILSLDADEILTPELAKEISDTLNSASVESFDGFRIPRILYIGDHAITHGGFYPDAQLRLFKRGKGAFNDRLVHESIKVQGKVGLLHYPMLHYAYPDLSAYADAMNGYALLSAEEFCAKGHPNWKSSRLNELVHPWWTFCYRFFFRAGFLDGAIGFKANASYKEYVRKKIAYLREHAKDKPTCRHAKEK